MTSAPLEAALEAWRTALGSDHLSTDQAQLAPFEKTTFPTSQKVLAVLRPGTVEEVSACLRIATEHGVPVYPISGGKNWGYGSAVPPRGDVAVLHLGRLDRIRDFDAESAYVTVEAGVTFAQLCAFVNEREPRLMVCVPGTSPEASVIGNAVERGLGIGPLRNRFEHVCGLEVVLPTGEIVHTDYARYANASGGPFHRRGVGPSFDGMFSQSNFGVVTSLTTWLIPKPKVFAMTMFHVERQHVGEMMAALGRDSDPNMEIRLQNPERLRALQATNGGRLATQAGDHWFGLIVYYARSAIHLRYLRSVVSDPLARLGKNVTYYRPLTLTAGHWLQRGLRKGYGALGKKAPRIVNDIWLGVPSQSPLRPLYAPKGGVPDGTLDPDADDIGLLWLAPAVPCRSADLDRVIEVMERAAEPHDMMPQINLRLLGDRVVDIVSSLVYDRATPGADARGRACHDAMFEAVVAEGYYPYRLGVQSMALLPPSDDDWDVLRARVKEALDPRGILAPGRYDGSLHGTTRARDEQS